MVWEPNPTGAGRAMRVRKIDECQICSTVLRSSPKIEGMTALACLEINFAKGVFHVRRKGPWLLFSLYPFVAFDEEIESCLHAYAIGWSYAWLAWHLLGKGSRNVVCQLT